ncbi:replication-relaxation family protein [Cytobacillus sp. IB215665]|uniref:replication-relaxation family protein n=1 Tax=Cytobacillus sp. IB215665 TaxID=3097357 RepID=UPI002A0AE6F0|nr:replication-relaxation family protein [Cytobacillus sp. IB215665]MDX8367205.1 replication-relaxation family protein [Cytobacillus sp. IB215665]
MITHEIKIGRPPVINYEAILYDLYRYQTLTIEQLKKVHFKGHEGSVYVSLHRMKKRGLVSSTCRVNEKGKKIAACYFITEKGIGHLEEVGLLHEKRRAYDNKPSGKKIPYLIDINNMYVDLQESGYEMLNARDWKEQHHLNRNALVKAGLRTPDGKEYGVYLFETDLEESITLPRFKKEIKEASQSNRFIIFFKGKDSYKKFKNSLGHEELTKGEMCLLPYNLGKKLLGELPKQDHLVKVFTNYGEVKINDRSNTVTSSFADYILEKDGQEFYVCNYVFGNEVALYFLTKYTKDRFARDGRRVYVFYSEKILSIMEQDFKEMFKDHYPHIEFIGL